jgi:hypothetical protein
VQIEFSCNHRANKLTKFIRKFEKFTYVLLIILHLYIKFQYQIYYSLAILKRDFFDRSVRLYLSEILSFLLFFCSYKIDLEILYIDVVESIEHL